MLVLFEDKIDKHLARLMKKKGNKAHINKIENEKGEITTDTTKIKTNHKRLPQYLYTNKMENL